MPAPRAFDHFVLTVAALPEARARFEALGFTVANDARHPFGTENCCVFLDDGTFIEPLAIGDPAAVEQALAAGNAFVGNDARTRAAGGTGIAQLVIRSDDAEGDHAAFVSAGISGGPVLDFGRTFTKADGSKGEVAFRLAFAAPAPAVGAGFFACEVVKAVPGGRGALTVHRNGAKVSLGVLAVADDPVATDGFLEFFLETTSEAGVEVHYPAEFGALRVMTPDVFAMLTGLPLPAPGALRLCALVIGVETLDAVRDIVARAGIAHHEKPGWLVVPPAAGQPAAIIFQGAD